MTQAMIEDAKEMCCSVWVGRKNPKCDWCNCEFKRKGKRLRGSLLLVEASLSQEGAMS